MNEDLKEADRYQSFIGLACDTKANQLITMLENNIKACKGDEKWHSYFKNKREQQAKQKHDNLNFIGHQTNTLYEYFEDCNDEQAKALLYRIEQDCC